MEINWRETGKDAWIIGGNMEGGIRRRYKETLEGDIGRGKKETRGVKHVEGDTWRHSKERYG